MAFNSSRFRLRQEIVTFASLVPDKAPVLEASSSYFVKR